MESLPQERLSGRFGAMEQQFLGPCFKVRWVSCRAAPFERAESVASAVSGSLSAKAARDGQELDSKAGAALCEELDKEVFRSEKCKKINKTKEPNTENKPAPTNKFLIENASKGAGKTKNMFVKKHKNTYAVFRPAKKRKVCAEAHNKIVT